MRSSIHRVSSIAGEGWTSATGPSRPKRLWSTGSITWAWTTRKRRSRRVLREDALVGVEEDAVRAVADGVDGHGEARAVRALDQPVEVALGEHHRAQPAVGIGRVRIGLEEERARVAHDAVHPGLEAAQADHVVAPSPRHLAKGAPADVVALALPLREPHPAPHPRGELARLLQVVEELQLIEVGHV